MSHRRHTHRHLEATHKPHTTYSNLRSRIPSPLQSTDLPPPKSRILPPSIPAHTHPTSQKIVLQASPNAPIQLHAPHTLRLSHHELASVCSPPWVRAGPGRGRVRPRSGPTHVQYTPVATWIKDHIL